MFQYNAIRDRMRWGMFLLEFLGTIGFVAVVLLGLLAMLDVFFPRKMPVLRKARVSGEPSRREQQVRAR